MVRRTDTRQRMLESAADLFQTQGYHATGLNQLVNAGGAPKGSLYFHFPGGKEQLAAEALAISGARLCDLLRRLLDAAPDPGAGIASVVDALGRHLAESDYQRGCPITTVAMDAAGNETIRQACDESYASWQQAIAEYLAGQGIDQAETLSMITLSAIEGALMLAKTQRDLAPLRAVGEHLRATITREH